MSRFYFYILFILKFIFYLINNLINLYNKFVQKYDYLGICSRRAEGCHASNLIIY